MSLFRTEIKQITKVAQELVAHPGHCQFTQEANIEYLL